MWKKCSHDCRSRSQRGATASRTACPLQAALQNCCSFARIPKNIHSQNQARIGARLAEADGTAAGATTNRHVYSRHSSMNKGTLFLYLINFAVIGALPFFFFREGRFNLMWCLTSAPYVLSAALLVWAYISGYQSPWNDISAVAAVPFSVGSIALIFLTVGTHRVPLALWHQKNDAPHQIVTHGPYRRIRHPFYSAFLLALFGAFLFSPQAGTLILFLYALVMLNFTAGTEKKPIISSPLWTQHPRSNNTKGGVLAKPRFRLPATY